MSATDRMPWDEIIDESHDIDNHRLPEDLLDDVPEHLAFTSDSVMDTEQRLASVDPDIIKKQRRASGAKGYEDKVTDILKAGVTFTVGNPATVVDAAAILMHADNVSYTLGDLAVADPHTAAVINFLHGGTGNPATAAAMAVMPMVLQILRNHEPTIETATRITIPFTRKRLGITIPSRFKVRISNNKVAAAMTNDPGKLYSATFTPAVVAEIQENLKVTVANYQPRHRAT